MPSRVVAIQASDLASCVGRHKYRPADEALVKYLRMWAPVSYNAYSVVTGQQTVDDKAKEVRKKLAAVDKAAASDLVAQVRGAVAGAVSKADYKADVQAALAVAEAKIDGMASMTGEEKQVLKDDVQKRVYTSIGTRSEAKVVAALPQPVRVDKVTRLKEIGEAFAPNGDKFSVCLKGQMDGLQTDADGRPMIVEIKKRMNHLFEQVVGYERVQVMAYMHLYDCEKAQIVESFQDEIMEHDVAFDGEQWAEIVGDAVGFAQRVLASAYEYDNGTLFPDKECDAEDAEDAESE